MKNHKFLYPILLLAASSLLLNACSFSFEVMSTPTSTPAVPEDFPSTPQALESTPAQTSVNDTMELASSDSDRLGVCFSYPQGYTQLPFNDAVERVYVVHEQTLYVLAFMPTRSENKAANDQMEALYSAVINSWAWSSCSVK